MARKNVTGPFKSFDSADISTDVTSAITDISYADNVGIILSWSGTSPVGEILVQCANPLINEKEADWVWDDLDFGATIAINGASGSHNININQAPYTKIRMQYVRTSGSGTLNARLVAKQVGG